MYQKLTDNIWILNGMVKRLVVAQSDYVRKMNEICSTSLPGGNQVDGLPPVSSLLRQQRNFQFQCGSAGRRGSFIRQIVFFISSEFGSISKASRG